MEKFVSDRPVPVSKNGIPTPPSQKKPDANSCPYAAGKHFLPGGVDGENCKNNEKERQWIRPDTPSKCTWKLGKPLSASPHHHASLPEPPKILPNILNKVGNTPLVRINKIGKHFGLKCELCEYCCTQKSKRTKTVSETWGSSG